MHTIMTNEDLEAGSTVDAERSDSGEVGHCRIYSPRMWCLTILGVSLVIGAIVLLGMVLPQLLESESTAAVATPPSSSSPMPEEPTPTPSLSPTLATTVTPNSTITASPTRPATTAPQDLIDLLSSVSLDGGTALLTPSTPQNSALNWLAGNTNLGTYTNEKKIQRFVLATLYYSTNGDAWHNNTGWLTDLDECTGWSNNAYDEPFCSSDGAVLELAILENNLNGKIPEDIGLLSNSLGEYLVVIFLLIFNPVVFLCCAMSCH